MAPFQPGRNGIFKQNNALKLSHMNHVNRRNTFLFCPRHMPRLKNVVSG